MKIHEFQAKEILAKHGVPIPRGGVASTPAEARSETEKLGGKAVLKAQVHAGGRGKAGGIRVVSSPQKAESAAEEMLGSKLVSFQTGPEGVPVRRLLVEELVDIRRELYVGLVIDGAAGGVVVMASQAGGIDIEHVASETPEKILTVAIDPAIGFQPFQGRSLAYRLDVDSKLVRPIAGLIGDLYRVFETLDCSLVEINPLVITADDSIIALDAKLTLDDDALFRHSELRGLRDPGQEDPLEVQAHEAGVSYIKLQGEIGCIVNGAGLAMATMDIASAAGAAPANFLDVGGAADEEKVAQALNIVLSDPGVEKVFVNVFGGILRCDVVARGLLMGAESTEHILRPVVVRMLGTNAEEGRKILSESGLDVTLVDDLHRAAEAIKADG